MRRQWLGAAGRYILAALLLMILALSTGNGWIWGVFGLLLLLPGLSTLANLLVRKGLRAKLQLPTTSPKTTACLGSLTVRNKSWLPAPKIFCRVRMVNDLTAQEQFTWLELSVPPFGQGQQEFLLESAHCGRIYVQLQQVKLFDYLGLIPLTVSLKAGARLTVLPELFPCQVAASPAPAVSDDSSLSRRGDDPSEVFQLREYRQGDDIRRIHWKLSSKLDKWILRESSQSVDRSLLVYWDKRFPCAPEQMDAMAEMVSSLCQGLCDSGISFDLGWTEGEEPQLRSIGSEDALLQTIPALVTQAGSPSCPVPDHRNYGQVLWIAPQLPDGQTGLVRYLLCTPSGTESGDALVCSPKNYQEILERVEI